jgi:hypothetical protein
MINKAEEKSVIILYYNYIIAKTNAIKEFTYSSEQHALFLIP